MIWCCAVWLTYHLPVAAVHGCGRGTIWDFTVLTESNREYVSSLLDSYFASSSFVVLEPPRDPIIKKSYQYYIYIHVCMQPLFSLSQRWSSFLTFKLPSLHVAPMAEQKSSRPISGVARVTAGRGRRCVGGWCGVGGVGRRCDRSGATDGFNAPLTGGERQNNWRGFQQPGLFRKQLAGQLLPAGRAGRVTHWGGGGGGWNVISPLTFFFFFFAHFAFPPSNRCLSVEFRRMAQVVFRLPLDARCHPVQTSSSYTF